METQYLNTFLVIIEAGSMSEAARRLDLTPAAVAQQMQVLAREFGAPLLRRSGRTVGPTEAGHRLASGGHALLADLAALRSTVTDAEGALTLTIGATNTMLNGPLPLMLEALVQTHPTARVTVRTGLTSELYDQLLHGLLDVALCLQPAFVLPKTLHWLPLREERLVVLAPEAWAHRDPHALLREEPLIRYDRRLGGGLAAERYLHRAGIVPRERFEISSLAAIAMLVGRGVGVSIAPDAATAWWPTLPVARLELPQASEARRFGFIWPRASSRSRAIDALAVHAKQVMATSSPRGASMAGAPTAPPRPAPRSARGR